MAHLHFPLDIAKADVTIQYIPHTLTAKRHHLQYRLFRSLPALDVLPLI